MNNPQHVGIIMDGNGRWAKERGLARTDGHIEGLKTTKKIAKRVIELGIPYLSLYVFSTENWKRTQEEVGFLMNLITQHLRSECAFYKEHRIRVVHSGDLTRLPEKVQKEILGAEQDTAEFTDGLVVNLLINYGGRDEIVRAVHHLVEKNQPITEDSITQNLDRPNIPDLDLVIRTAGELRLSNFMIWQAAYAELHFVQKYWPDFSEQDLDLALQNYRQRQRKFGAIA